MIPTAERCNFLPLILAYMLWFICGFVSMYFGLQYVVVDIVFGFLLLRLLLISCRPCLLFLFSPAMNRPAYLIIFLAYTVPARLDHLLRGRSGLFRKWLHSASWHESGSGCLISIWFTLIQDFATYSFKSLRLFVRSCPWGLVCVRSGDRT
jgi:hypothetical protein